MSTPVITLSRVSLDWPDGTVALDDVSGTFGDGSTGLVGRNGTGKSTLLRLIAGELAATAGTVTVGGDVAMLHQQQSIAGGTVADALGIAPVREAIAAVEAGDVDQARFDAIGDRWDIDAEALDALAALGLPSEPELLDRRVASLSGGQAILVGLAGVRFAAAPITLLDEPTNNLDRSARSALLEAVRTWRGTLVVVSHDRELLEHVDRIAELHGHALRTFEGPYSVYERAIVVEQEAAARRVQDAEAAVRKERKERIEAAERRSRAEAAGRRAQRAGGIPKIMANGLKGQSERSTARSKALHEGREADARASLEHAEEALRDDRSIVVTLPDTRVPAGRTVLDLGDGAVVLRGPERVALSGDNGTGKSTLLEAIVAHGDGVPSVAPAPVLPVTHRIEQVGILRQRTVLDGSRTLVESIRDANPSASPHEARAMLARFLFRGGAGDRQVAQLSGGERFRLALARALLADPAPQLLLLDEPTNDLDLDAIRQLTEALAAFEGALVVVSHDERFLADLGLTRRWTIAGGVLVDEPFAARSVVP